MVELIAFVLTFSLLVLLPSLMVSLFVAIPFINALGFVVTMRLFFPVHLHKGK